MMLLDCFGSVVELCFHLFRPRGTLFASATKGPQTIQTPLTSLAYLPCGQWCARICALLDMVECLPRRLRSLLCFYHVV